MKNHTLKLLTGLIVLVTAVCLCVFAGADVVYNEDFGDSLHWTLYDDGLLTISGIGSMNGEHPWTEYWDRYPVKRADILNGVKDLSVSAFSGCTKMTHIKIPDSIKSISDHAFYRCYDLTSVTLPGGLLKIEDSAFLQCSSLSSISIPGTVTSIEAFAFDSSGLTSFTMPNSVKEIGTSAFQSCTSLKSITFSSAISAIPGSALSSCSSLTSVTIPANVAKIERAAFRGCSALATATIQNKNCDIADNAFDNDPKLTLYGYTGSTAEAYAKAKNIPFKALDETPAGPTEKVTLSKLKSVKLTALSAKKLKVTWKKLSSKDQKKIQKIQIQYSTDKTFKTGVKTKWAKKGKTSYTISGLKKNTKYWVRIRAYKKEGNTIFVSKWITKNKKTKKK